MKATEYRTKGLYKKLRTRIYQAGLESQMMEEENREAVKGFIEGLKELVGYSALVMMEEERSLFPGIISVAPFMVPLLEQEHIKVSALGEKICVLADEYEDAYADSERAKTFMQVISAFHEWMAFLMQHLHREEMIVKQATIDEMGEERKPALIAA